jgi:hypothetical protein
MCYCAAWYISAGSDRWVESNGRMMIRRGKKKNSDKKLQNVTSSTMDLTLRNWSLNPGLRGEESHPTPGPLLNQNTSHWRHICIYFPSNKMFHKATYKGKAIPVTGREGPQVCERPRLPHFLDNWLTDGSAVVSLTLRPLFTPRKIPGTHLC